MRFKLNGDTADLVSRMDSGLIDDHAFLTPLGNLLALGSDHNNDRKIIISVSGTERDTLPPHSLFTSPADGTINQHVLSRVGISFSDWVDPKSVDSSTIKIRNVVSGEIVPGSYSVMMGIVNFVPTNPLGLNSTYDVILSAGGVKDQVGNAVPSELRLARFSTGSEVTNYQTKLQQTTPVLVGQAAQLALSVTNPTGNGLEHSWNFGDGTGDTAFSAATTATHTYTGKGNFEVSIKTRVSGTLYATAVSGVQVAHGPISAQKPRVQSTIVVDPNHTIVWNVNPDNDSVTGVDSVALARIHEIAVGDQPVALALGSQDRLWVANKKASSLSVIHRPTGALINTYALPIGSQPHGLIADPVAGVVYVALESLGEVAKISETTGQILSTIQVGPWPRSLSLDPVRGVLWVSRFISPDQGGRVVPVDLTSFTMHSQVSLSPVMEADGLQNGRGIPNYLAAVTLSPDLAQAFIPSKKDNIFRGLKKDGLPLTFEHSVRSMAANLNLATRAENTSQTLDFDNSDFATAAAFSPLGNMIFFTTSGSSTVWAVDAYDATSTYTFSSGGLAPDGLAVSADGTQLFVHNFMDRSVTVFRSTAACGAFCGTAPQIAKIPTIAAESLTPQILRGKQLFYDAKDPRMAQEGYMSCASCHLDGGHDGRVWDFTNLGEGLRNTIDLTGRGQGHGAVHWSGNFDEVHDFEGQIRGFSQALGLMDNAKFHQGSRSLPMGESKTGISSDLDALAAYVGSLTTVGISPRRSSAGSLSPSASAGRQIFTQENCATCHSGSAFSDSASLMRHDVGTLSSASGDRLGSPLDGLDTPTLRGLWKSAPYLHDGSATTLHDVLVANDLSGRHGNLFHRSPVEIDQLVSYLESIDDLELSAPTSFGSAPVIAPRAPLSHPTNRVLSVQLSATGQAPFIWSALALPAGLEIDATTGAITGAPSAAGDFTARIGVRDAAGRTASLDLGWTITDPFAHRFVKLVSYSSQNGQPFSSIAEFNLLDINGQPLNRNGWQVTASTQESSAGNYIASLVIDGQNGTLWHSAYSAGTLPFPHEIIIDLGTPQSFNGFSCLPRQDGNSNGWINSFGFFTSTDGISWGPAALQGQFTAGNSLQTVMLQSQVPHPVDTRYVKLVSLSSQNASEFTVMSEFNLLDATGLPISRAGWLASASSAETSAENGAASLALDGLNNTHWHTVWSSAVPPFPHEFIVDLGSTRTIHGFSSLPRQDGIGNGRTRDYRFHHSSDGVTWSAPIAAGTFADDTSAKEVMFSILPYLAPVHNVSSAAFSVTENATLGTLLGAVSATDPNSGQTITYSLGSGNAAGVFVINPLTGELRVARTSAIDYETQPIYHLQVITTDNGTPATSSSHTYTILVGNVIETNAEAVTIRLRAPGAPYEGQGNPALTGFTADPDGDGSPNAIEILLGTDPARPDAQAPIRPVTAEHDGQTWMAYEYKISASSGLALRCIASSDLTHWTPLANAPFHISTQGDIQTWRVWEDEPLITAPKRFIRLEVAP
ncbi:MAG: discoidin domain-containing protein [Luteolibacter sp.]